MATAFVRKIEYMEGNIAFVNGVAYEVESGKFSVGDLVVEVSDRDEILPVSVLGAGYFLMEDGDDVSDVVK